MRPHSDLIRQWLDDPEAVVEWRLTDAQDWVENVMPNWNPYQQYRIRSKEKKKVEMWKFAYQIGLRKGWVETENFYQNAEAVARLIKADEIVRIDGTRIEVEAAE